MSSLTTLLARRRLLLAAAGAVLMVALVAGFLPRLLATDPVMDEGGGPPEVAVVPPFEEDTFAPVVALRVPAGEACSWISVEEMTAATGAAFAPSGTADGCAWSGGGMEVELSMLDEPLSTAFPTFAEDWPDWPEVVTEPANGLFFHDGDRGALLLDAEDRAVAVTATAPGTDRDAHLARLFAIAGLLAD